MSCLFCRIVAREISARIVHEDDDVLAFEDLSPQAPVHVLVIPKKHLSSVDGAGAEDALLLGKILLGAREVARARGLGDAGYRLVANNGAGAGQSVFHLHVHVLGGRPLSWPPG